jgi:hypothetical protein
LVLFFLLRIRKVTIPAPMRNTETSDAATGAITVFFFFFFVVAHDVDEQSPVFPSILEFSHRLK